MDKCPHCGFDVRPGSVACPTCKRSLVRQGYTHWTTDRNRPPVLGSLLLGVLIFLTLALLGAALFEIEAVVAGVYSLLASLFLGWLGARGRYESPTLRQSLLTMLIALVPVIGTAYAAYFAGRYLVEERRLRFGVYLALLLSLGVWALVKGGLEKLDLEKYLALLDRPATFAPAVTPTSDEMVATAMPSATVLVLQPTSTLPAFEASPTVAPGPENCLHWSAVTLDMVGQEVCAYGDYLRIGQKDDGTYVLYFSEEPGTFQVWSSPRPLEPYLPKDGGRCVMVRGWVRTSGVRPFVFLGTEGMLEACP